MQTEGIAVFADIVTGTDTTLQSPFCLPIALGNRISCPALSRWMRLFPILHPVLGFCCAGHDLSALHDAHLFSGFRSLIHEGSTRTFRDRWWTARRLPHFEDVHQA